MVKLVELFGRVKGLISGLPGWSWAAAAVLASLAALGGSLHSCSVERTERVRIQAEAAATAANLEAVRLALTNKDRELRTSESRWSTLTRSIKGKRIRILPDGTVEVEDGELNDSGTSSSTSGSDGSERTNYGPAPGGTGGVSPRPNASLERRYTLAIGAGLRAFPPEGEARAATWLGLAGARVVGPVDVYVLGGYPPAVAGALVGIRF